MSVTIWLMDSACFPRRHQLADARDQLLREAEAREKLEENMKQAFMRGGSFLFREILSLHPFVLSFSVVIILEV